MTFWLMKYGAGSAKRLMMKSNWPSITKLDLGKLPRAERIEKTTVQTARYALSMLHACAHCAVDKAYP